MLVCTATGARPGIAAFVIVTAMLGDQEAGRNRSECKKQESRNRPLAIRAVAR
jgi:hypothetical protein